MDAQPPVDQAQINLVGNGQLRPSPAVRLKTVMLVHQNLVDERRAGHR